MPERINFDDEIASNKLKSVLLMAFIIVCFIILGYIISLVLNPGYFFIIMILSIIISMLYIIISYYNAEKIALASVNARPASREKHRMFFNSAESLCLASGIPMPKLYIMESEQINAFASGRNPENAVICVTTGALNKLNKQELEGVIAHELGHVANYDIRFMTLTAVLVGMISIAAEIFLRSLWFSGHSNGRDNRNALLIILGIAFAILAPLAAKLVSLAISRKREFTADASGVKFTRYPPGLINALKKIKAEHVSEQDAKRYPKAVAPLFISDPFKKKLQGLLSTHPDVDARIKLLERM